jgi:murein DD-endopeptidase MepM/ murein hydrolase activator NlpD
MSDRWIWPVPGAVRISSVLGDPRDGGRRRHCGIDIPASRGTEVVAVESGIVVRAHGFLGPLAHAVWVRGASGDVLYGEVEPGSWPPVGASVSAGDRVAEVGIAPRGGQGLHFEWWDDWRNRRVWLSGEPRPRGLLDPQPRLIPPVVRRNAEKVPPVVSPPGRLALVAVLVLGALSICAVVVTAQTRSLAPRRVAGMR